MATTSNDEELVAKVTEFLQKLPKGSYSDGETVDTPHDQQKIVDDFFTKSVADDAAFYRSFVIPAIFRHTPITTIGEHVFERSTLDELWKNETNADLLKVQKVYVTVFDTKPVWAASTVRVEMIIDTKTPVPVRRVPVESPYHLQICTHYQCGRYMIFTTAPPTTPFESTLRYISGWWNADQQVYIPDKGTAFATGTSDKGTHHDQWILNLSHLTPSTIRDRLTHFLDTSPELAAEHGALLLESDWRKSLEHAYKRTFNVD